LRAKRIVIASEAKQSKKEEDMGKLKNLAVPVLSLLAVAALAAGWLNASQSTRRYIVHLGKQVPYLPYRYFI
jgi:hypothetical protein